MWLTSIRTRVVALSTLSAVLLIGSTTCVTYFIVARNMVASADAAFAQLTLHAGEEMKRAVENAEEEIAEEPQSPDAASALVAEHVLKKIPPGVLHTPLYEDLMTLYVWDAPSSEERIAWTSGAGRISGAPEGRARARDTGTVAALPASPDVTVYGMFQAADLGEYLAYIPVTIPGVHGAVLQISYVPAHEEGILDETRAPMIAVMLVAAVVAVLLATASAEWMLSLVENLRRAADAATEGEFDVRLPETGDNEVTALARSFNHLIDKLRRGTEAQTRFIADASHELATPIAGIRGYVNILRAWGSEDRAMRDEAVAAIDRESRRMARLCVDMLSLIRNTEVVEFRNIRYDINAVAREVLAGMVTAYSHKGLVFSGPGKSARWLHGDPDRVREVIHILLDNACRYTPSGGSVSLATHTDNRQVLLTVTDTGCGIATEDIPGIFERFYHCDISHSGADGGFGLGLAIAKHIVDASGGAILVESEPGHGSTFTVSLPRQRTANR